jgi:hypothetical protein
LLLFLILSTFAFPAFAQQVVLDHLRITLDTKASRKLPKGKQQKKEYDKAFKTACDKLGKAMVAGQGPWGFGAFATYGCYQGKKKVAGTEKPGKWAMTIVDGKKDVEFDVVYTSVAGTKVDVATVTMPASTAFFKFFIDDEFTDVVAFTILERLPMGMQIAKANVKGAPPQFSGRHARAGKGKSFKYKTPEPPEELVLFRVAWDEQAKSWRSTVVGKAKKVKVAAPKKKKKGKQVTLQGGEVVYETSDAVSQELAQSPLWVHSTEGPGAREEELDGVVREASKLLQTAEDNESLLDFINGGSAGVLDDLLSTAASGYVGMRYGLQALSGDPLLAKTSMFGLLVEVRGGPVKGLRYYYDKVPKAEASQPLSDSVGGGTTKTSIESARHVLGYSFDFDPGLLLDRVTIDPKLGMWSFAAELPSEYDEQGKVLATKKFELGSTFSVALEIGLEMLSEWYTLRGWYAIDSGFSLLQTGGRVTSNRFGFDAYFTAGPSFPIFGVPFKTALLAFFVYEDVSLTAGKPKDPQPGEKEIEGVGYSGGFAGGGIGVTW